MKNYNVYYENDTDTGNIIVTAANEKEAQQVALETLRYDANFIEVIGEVKESVK